MDCYRDIIKALPQGISTSECLVFSLTYYEGRNNAFEDNQKKGQSYEEALESREEFSRFIKAAAVSKTSPEYKSLYKFLLKCFTDADEDLDGQICYSEFNTLIEVAAAAPRKFGFAPSGSELYESKEIENLARSKMFKEMDANGDEHISFSEWLKYVYQHIQYKTLSMEVVHKSRMSRNRDSFVQFISEAVESSSSPAYKELYHFLLKCFTEADSDFDGQVGPYEFDVMIEAAAAAPRKFGFAPSNEKLYVSMEDRIEARKQMMSGMDVNSDGFISFSEWLTYSMNHIRAKVLDSFGVEPKDSPKETNETKVDETKVDETKTVPIEIAKVETNVENIKGEELEENTENKPEVSENKPNKHNKKKEVKKKKKDSKKRKK